MFVPLCLISRIPRPSAAASKPFDRLDRGPPRQGIAVYGVASLLLPARTPAVSAVAVAAALTHPAPAVASPDERVPVPTKTNSQRIFEASHCNLQSGLPLKRQPIFCLSGRLTLLPRARPLGLSAVNQELLQFSR